MSSPAAVRDRPSLPLRPRGETGAPSRSRVWSGPAIAGVVLAAGVAVAAWLPFLLTPLTPDESGFLFVGRHWGHGTSLYGDYWVDRPPLLLWLFGFAGHLAPVGRAAAAGVTAPGLKLLGAAASGTTVLLTGLVAGLVAPDSRWHRGAAVILAVVLLSSPYFGMPETDGEVLALPFVMAGLACLISALRRPRDRWALLLAVGAGGFGMAGALVKQNVIDVFVFGLTWWVLARERGNRRWGLVAAFVGGGLTVLAVAVAAAAAQGTSPAGLWDAIVVFRLHASAVIGSSASGATAGRLSHLAGAFLASGAAVVLVVTVSLTLLAAYRRWCQPAARAAVPVLAAPYDLAWPVLVLVAWELCGVVLGGSYWLHYLTGLVPGLVLLVSLVGPGRRRGLLLAGCLVYAVAANASVWTHHATTPVSASTDTRVVSYLRGHADRSDGVVVAFGHPDIVAGSGLASPYPELWSLPVRVRDPRLRELVRVMSGPRAPRWMVVAGDSLDSWGLDAHDVQDAQAYLERHYVEQVTYGGWRIWRRRGGDPR